MNLLHVISGMDPAQGGVAQAVRTIIAGLADQGVHSEVASLDAPDEPWGQADPFVTHALGPGQGPWNYSPKLIPWLLANFSRFDAVVLHGLWLYHGYAVHKALRRYSTSTQPEASVSGKKTRPQFFVMPHGMLDPYFQRATGRKLKAWRNWAYWKLIEGAVVNNATGILFTCETERLLAHEPFSPYQPKKEIVVGLGVEEPPAYLPAMREAFLAKCPELQNRPYLLFLSRIHEKKGVELLLRAYAHMPPTPPTAVATPQPGLHSEGSTLRGQQTKPVLVIAGPGLETPYGQRMQQLATELSVSATVFFPGMLTGAAKWGAFYGCEAFVLPSHQENFGIAVVEALSCSKPVLISNQVNIWREIEAAGGGIIADDTLEGTQQLLASWSKLSESEKRAFNERAQLCYRTCFATEPAAEKMASICT